MQASLADVLAEYEEVRGLGVPAVLAGTKCDLGSEGAAIPLSEAQVRMPRTLRTPCLVPLDNEFVCFSAAVLWGS